MKVLRLSAPCTGRLYLPANIPSTHFCTKLSTLQGRNAAGRITSMKNVQYQATNMYLWKILSKRTICSISTKIKLNIPSRNSEKLCSLEGKVCKIKIGCPRTRKYMKQFFYHTDKQLDFDFGVIYIYIYIYLRSYFTKTPICRPSWEDKTRVNVTLSFTKSTETITNHDHLQDRIRYFF